MSMVCRRNDNWQEKTEGLAEKPFSVTFAPAQTWTFLGSNLRLCDEKPPKLWHWLVG
jgi:hypothetical protein